ncbi:hypothetical protein ACQP2F_01680 [Actinoplanes sp. CA-030573]|uniref:hypothetical protein n=1 Tax=Actinoplanes sp. CA-030573 TaxID=3239898 RepID=UPI003D9359DC
MKPARSLAASVAAIGFAGSVAAPLPAFAAPAPCERAENYAAQSGAELFRIDRLEVRGGGSGGERPVTREHGSAKDGSATARTLRATGLAPTDGTGFDPTDHNGEDSDSPSESIGETGVAILHQIFPNGSILPQAGAIPVGESGDAEPATEAATGEGGQGAAGQGGGGAESADESGQGATGGQGGGGAMPGSSRPASGIGGGAARKAGNEGEGGAADGSAGESGAADGKAVTLGEVGVGEARTALIATASVKSAAVARTLDGEADGKPAWTKPVLQVAPPSHAKPATRTTSAGRVGPLKLGAGEASGLARWDAGMACGSVTGEASRAQAAVNGASILGGPLFRMPGKAATLSTTALEGHAGNARTVATATITAGRVELAGGRVRVRILKAPSLVADMSAEGGDVRYQPAQVEVSGDGIATKRLNTVGDHVDVTLAARDQATEGVLDAMGMRGLHSSRPLPLPHVAGLPTVTAPTPESAGTASDGTRLRIELGGVRQARRGHAVAARATALRVSIVEVDKGSARKEGASKGAGDSEGAGGSEGAYGSKGTGDSKGAHGSKGADGNGTNDGKPGGNTTSDGRTKPGYGQRGGTSQSLAVSVGLLEAAAVAPESAPTSGTGGTGGSGGAAGGEVAGLPITGPQVSGLAIGGAALLVAGVAAVLFGLRRRRSHS